jgi:hypothetical protein
MADLIDPAYGMNSTRQLVGAEKARALCRGPRVHLAREVIRAQIKPGAWEFPRQRVNE